MRLARVLAFVVLLSACDRIQAPQFDASGVSTLKISISGADVEASLDVTNPNKNALTANGIDCKVTIGGKANAARAMVTEALVLPPGQKIRVKVPIHVEWTDQAAIAALAATKQPAEYTVEGTVSFAAQGSTLQTPLKIQGVMTPAELAQAAGNAPSGSAPTASASAPPPKPSASAAPKPSKK